ncbi:SH3 domain-containing protein [Treponema zioleckii]|uniref:SH3 domain-containing protein n=1 Tax=Treponema zioleckii TaxID=331680 RepID=UPI00168A8336|nr:SH3 domain-containing protein [Treponema zioleckii]
MKKLLLCILTFVLFCSCKDKAINYKDFDQSMSFDEAEKYVKQLEQEIKKENWIRSTDSDGIEVWRDKNANVRKEIKISKDGIKETTYFDEEGKCKFYTDSNGFKKWYDYDDSGRIIYERENCTYRYPEKFYEYVKSKRFTVEKRIIPAEPSEKWYRKNWKDSFSAEDVLIYEKYENKEIWHMHNPLVVTKMREAYSENLDKENCQEVSFGESKKIMEELQDDSIYSENQEPPEVFFKTKCHFSHADEKNYDSYWFYSDGEDIEGIDESPFDSQEYYFPIDMPSFTPIELYYHYQFYFDEDSGSYKIADYDKVIIDGWKVLDEVRFVGHKYRATDDLMIYSEQGLDYEVIGYIKIPEEGIEVLEIGNFVSFDGTVELPWLKIRTEKGLEGWCFAGYLTDGWEYKNNPWTSTK